MERRERDSFLTPLIVEVMPSGKLFRLFVPFTFDWHGIRIRIGAGFETDFASIPRIFRWLIEKLGRWNKPAVVHDAIYQGLYTTPSHVHTMPFTRAEADDIFLDGMIALGVAPWKRRLMYWAVRICGWAAWRNS